MAAANDIDEIGAMKLLTPERVRSAIGFLCSKQPGWGQIFTIDIGLRPPLEIARYRAPTEDKLSRSLLSCHLPRQ